MCHTFRTNRRIQLIFNLQYVAIELAIFSLYFHTQFGKLG
ncbi:Uncharacterised protein [Vibrio cholerae]|nr:Uncharacterised protein [Vibrio cholerae]